MLTRLYVDNYKSLLNFEFRPPRLCVLIGENGAGKTSIGGVFQRVAQLLVGRFTASEAFPTETLCRWSQADLQVIEFEHQVSRGHFKYRLELRHDRKIQKVTIAAERLHIDGDEVYAFVEGGVHVRGSSAPTNFAFDPSLSFLAHLDDATARSVTRGFLELVVGQLALKPDPTRMTAIAPNEDPGLASDAANFSAWFRHFIQSKPELIAGYFAQLKGVLPGFRNLFLEQSGRVKLMRAIFESPQGSIDLSLEELSDGQRQLLLLYSLLHDFEEGHLLFLDEPDNFISIREVQPWLSELERVLDEKDAQAIIVSHGTEAMNYLGARQAFVVSRVGGGPTRIAPHDSSDGTMPSESVLFGSEAASK